MRCGALELSDGCRWIVQRQRRERRESSFLRRDHFCKSVVDQTRQAHGSLGRLDVGAGRSEGNHLRVHAVPDQHLLAIIYVAMARDGDVVVARIVQARIPLSVDGNAHGARSGA